MKKFSSVEDIHHSPGRRTYGCLAGVDVLVDGGPATGKGYRGRNRHTSGAVPRAAAYVQ